MDFFNVSCQDPEISDVLFGICDDQSHSRAYINTDEQSKWIATVKNIKNKKLIFTAIDKCVIKDGEETERGRCDGMLTSNEHIYFIELKEGAREWKIKAIAQLESTIQFFIANHDINNYTHKKAFACHKRRRHFQEIDNELNLHFFRTYGVRLDVQADIIVI